MVIVFTLALTGIVFISTDARNSPKVKLFKIVFDLESDEFTDHEAQNIVNKVKNVEDTPRSETGNLALQLMSEIDMLLGSQDSDLSNSEDQDNFTDETRTSVVLMPRDSNKVYHIDMVKPDAKDKMRNRSKNLHWIKKFLQRKEPEPTTNVIKGAPRTNQLHSLHLLSDILDNHNPFMSSESQEHSAFDETRSSLVTPPDSDKIYHM